MPANAGLQGDFQNRVQWGCRKGVKTMMIRADLRMDPDPQTTVAPRETTFLQERQWGEENRTRFPIVPKFPFL